MNPSEYYGLNLSESDILDIYQRRAEARLSLANPAPRTLPTRPEARADENDLMQLSMSIYRRRREEREEAALSVEAKAPADVPATRIPGQADSDLGSLAESVYSRRRAELAGEPVPQVAAPAAAPPVQAPAPAMPARSQAAPVARPSHAALSNGAPPMVAIAGGRVQWGAA